MGLDRKVKNGSTVTSVADELFYPVAAEASVGRAGIVKAHVDFDRVVATLVLVLQFKGQKGEVHVLAARRFDDPVAVFLVLVVVVAVFRVGIKVLDAGRRLQMAAAH